jgi:sugar lactone lactonase YvrE
LDAAGNVLVADSGNHTIRVITPAQAVSTLAGTPGITGFADGDGTAAVFAFPSGIAVDSEGNMYVADSANRRVRRVTPAGSVATVAGSTNLPGFADGSGTSVRFGWPGGIAVDGSGNVFVADGINCTIRRVTPAGVASTVAGSPQQCGSADGTGTAARFGTLDGGIAVDASGNLFVADSNTIRRVTPAGVVTTLAGTPSAFGGFANGTGAAALFRTPTGLAVDNAGNVYVADTGNNTIRRIAPGGVVSTLAGSERDSFQPDATGSTDGVGTAARFSAPAGVAVDATGTVYVGDTDNHTIRRITPAGEVSTVAGSAGQPGSADLEGALARFRFPGALAMDAGGDLYVVDGGNQTIRVVAVGSNLVSVMTFAGRVGGLDPSLGPLPQAIGSPAAIALTTKRLYFVIGNSFSNSILFIDR